MLNYPLFRQGFFITPHSVDIINTPEFHYYKLGFIIFTHGEANKNCTSFNHGEASKRGK